MVGVERLKDGQWRWTMMPGLPITLRAALLIGIRTSLLVARRTIRSGWPEFVCRQFAVAIFIERLQGGGGVRDFIRIDHAIVVGVESLHNRGRRRTMMTPPLRSPFPTALRRRSALILGESCRDSQTNDHCCHPNKSR